MITEIGDRLADFVQDASTRYGAFGKRNTFLYNTFNYISLKSIRMLKQEKKILQNSRYELNLNSIVTRLAPTSAGHSVTMWRAKTNEKTNNC